MTHRINNNEMDPKTECGLELDGSITLATIHETPTCKDCIGVDTMTQQQEPRLSPSGHILNQRDQTGIFDFDGGLTIYDFENRDDAWGTTYGINLLYQWFSEEHIGQMKGMSVYMTPIGKVVVTCRSIVLITKLQTKAIEWMRNNIDMDIDSLRETWIANAKRIGNPCGCEDGWAICDTHMEQAERLGVDLT